MSLRSRFFPLSSFPKKNKNTSEQRHDVDEKNARPQLQTESEQAMENQINRKQNHTDVFVNFHGVELADRPFV